MYRIHKEYIQALPKVTQKITCRNRILGNDAFKTHPKTGPRTCQTHPKTDPRNSPEMQLRKIPESGLGKTKIKKIESLGGIDGFLMSHGGCTSVAAQPPTPATSPRGECAKQVVWVLPVEVQAYPSPPLIPPKKVPRVLEWVSRRPPYQHLIRNI